MALMLFTNLLFLVLCPAASSTGIEGRWVTTEAEELKSESETKALHMVHVNNSQGKSASYLNGSGGFINNVLPQGNGGENRINHWAMLMTEAGEYYGTKATINVWGLPQIGGHQSSAALIWVANGVDGSSDHFNEIKAGWHVQPSLYGDQETHLFVGWRVGRDNSFRCPDINCKGFVVDKSSKYIPGNRLEPWSIYNGAQYSITLKISKDLRSGDWWLHAGPYGDKPVGYWPKSLFTSLRDSASVVSWGGIVGSDANEKTPPMGSGHLPNEGERRAAYLKNVQLLSIDGQFYDPTLLIVQDRVDCYRVFAFGRVLLFGGWGDCV